MGILDKLKDELGDIAEDQLANIKKDLAGKIDDVFDDDLQKEIVDALNKSVDIPFINEKMEAGLINFAYDIFEEKMKAAVKKVL